MRLTLHGPDARAAVQSVLRCLAVCLSKGVVSSSSPAAGRLHLRPAMHVPLTPTHRQQRLSAIGLEHDHNNVGLRHAARRPNSTRSKDFNGACRADVRAAMRCSHVNCSAIESVWDNSPV